MTTTSNRHLGQAACALVLAACSGSPAADPSLDSRQENIIGGIVADSPALDHTGALGYFELDGSFYHFCTATLIGPQTVVTAKHCADLLPNLERSRIQAYFATGPDVSAPKLIVPIVAAATAPGDLGGFVRLGRDVAVVFLDTAPPIEPAQPAPIDASFVGVTMISIGYGVHGATGLIDERRRIGRETVVATEGLTLEHLFGSFENFVEWNFTGDYTDADFIATLEDDPFLEETLAWLRDAYEIEVLFEEHEAVTGGAPLDTQSCNGDSGGPLLRIGANGEWLTYGVVSGGYYSSRLYCDYGTVFATFGPTTLAFLEASRTWQDPCGDVGAAGVCDGSVLQRCETSFIGNRRRLVTTDCAAQGEPCATSEAGAACGEAPPPPEPPTAPPEDVRGIVRESFLATLPFTPLWLSEER